MTLSRLDARVLKEHAANDAQYAQFAARRLAGEPVAYIIGEKEFWSLTFDVGPGVLVPRPDTETLVEQALKEFPDRAAPLRVADFGTGSGAILLSFLSERPGARGVGIDSSPDALAYAKRSAKKIGLDGRCEFHLGDWSSVDGTFAVIFANPPYLTTQEVAAAPAELGFEPRGALDGGADGLDAYQALAPLIASRLNKRGVAFLEIGQGQGDAVTAILAAAGLETVRIAPDLSGIPRCVMARLAKSPWKGPGEAVVS